MKRLATAALGLVTALAGLVALPSAASAYNGYDATATNVSYTSDSCFSSHVSISGFDTSDDSPGYEIEVTAPNGAYVDGDYVFGDDTERLSPLLCYGSDPTGRYSVTVDGVEVTAFSVAKPAISAVVVHPGTRSAGVVGQLTLRGQALAGRRVKVQYQAYGYWYDSKSFTTRRDGRVGVVCSKRGYDRTCARRYFRFNYNGVAASRAFHLPRRR